MGNRTFVLFLAILSFSLLPAGIHPRTGALLAADAYAGEGENNTPGEVPPDIVAENPDPPENPPLPENPVLPENPPPVEEFRGYPLHLTFDDGPNPATTPQVLAILARHGIKATFFMVGRRLASAAGQELLNQIVGQGHQVANHTWDHPWLTQLDNAAVRKQIVSTREQIRGRENGWFFLRPPGGFHNARVDDVIAGERYRIVMWDIDTNDWKFNQWSRQGNAQGAPANFYTYVTRATAAAMRSSRLREGSVVLMHDIHQYTANRLEQLIVNWKAQGCSFVDHLGHWSRYRSW